MTTTPLPAKTLPRGIAAGLAVLVVAGLAAAAFFGGPGMLHAAGLGASPQAQATAVAAPQTAQVTTLTAETRVTASGPVTAVQSGAVFWKTTGNVAEVYVQPGDPVQAGQALMRLDPLSAPQAVIAAQADLVTAQRALDDLTTPPELTLAQAQKNVANAQKALDDLRTPPAVNVALARQAVAKAEDTLDKAQTTLDEIQSPDVKFYEDQFKKAQDAYTNAQQNTTLVDIGALQVSLRNAQKQLQTATDVYNNAKDAFAQCPACLKVFAYDRMTTWEDAVNLYTDAVNQVQVLQTQIDQSQRGSSLAVDAAKDNLDAARNHLDWALAGPKATTLGVAEAAVSVAQASVADTQDKLNELLTPKPEDVALAEASLADAQDKLNHLQHGADPRDLAVAQARLEAAQATVSGLTLTAPFAGEVLAVNYQAGDAVGASQAAVTLANRQVLRVEAQIDEADIRHIAVGNPVSVTFEALPGVTLAGEVTWINAAGTTLQGLVKYTVRTELRESAPGVLLGMTADVSILASQQAGVLAVPLGAVLRDGQGEYVNRVRGSAVERVSVTSGAVQGSLVVVSGALQAGDEVQVFSSRAP